jgi:RHS repeat-associated protein
MVNETYTYDDIYRLTQAVTPQGTEKYSYDDVGNRLTGPGAKDSGYQHNDGNQMISGRTLAYLFDNRGNQTTRTVPGASDKSWTLSWDFENRLTKMEKIKGLEKRTVTFKYDPMGRRIEKKLTTVIDGVTKTGTTTFVYDGDTIALELSSDGITTSKSFYTHGQGTDEHLALERNGQNYYFHADGLGSITAITDASRAVVQAYGYDSFGMVTPTTGFENSYTYTGREWDREIGLYYYRARYYDPMEGRFISVDPVPLKKRTQDQLNSYAYTANNPINFTDPSGENIYGNWCGPGGSGPVKDGVDAICKNHDECFDKTGVTWINNVFGTGDKNKKECISDCNKELCNDLMKYNFKTFAEYMGVLAIMSYFNCK